MNGAMRLEYKFLVPDERVESVLDALSPYLKLDPFAARMPNHHYTVRSIYLDTRYFKYYHEKIEGYRVRKKVRIRSYNKRRDESHAFLEIKRKYENYITKNRASLLYNDLEEYLNRPDEKLLTNGADFEKNREDAKRFYHHVLRHSLSPSMLVVYDRRAFSSNYGYKVRATMDRHLRYHAFPKLDGLFTEDLHYAFRGRSILEIKFYGSYPRFFKEIIKKLGLQRMALSKYTICLNAYRKRAFYWPDSTLGLSKPVHMLIR